MTDEIKNIKLSLPYCLDDGTLVTKEQVVSFKSVTEKEKASYWNNQCSIYSMNMSIAIPDHIHAKLKGSLVPRKTSLRDDKGRQYAVDFKKTLTSNNLEGLTTAYRDILYDYKWLCDLEKMTLAKVIFYNFSGDIIEMAKSYWDGKLMGNNSKIEYRYMIGYIGTSGTKQVRLNADKKIIQERDGEETKYKYVAHTDYREQFFDSILSKFKKLLQDLTDFEEKINEKSIDTIISNQKLLTL